MQSFERAKNLSYRQLALFCIGFFCIFALSNKKENGMKKRTEQEWRQLHEAAVCAFIAGRAAQPTFMTYEQCVDEAIYGADYLVEEMKKLEEIGEKETSWEK